MIMSSITRELDLATRELDSALENLQEIGRGQWCVQAQAQQVAPKMRAIGRAVEWVVGVELQCLGFFVGCGGLGFATLVCYLDNFGTMTPNDHAKYIPAILVFFWFATYYGLLWGKAILARRKFMLLQQHLAEAAVRALASPSMEHTPTWDKYVH